MDAAAKLEAKSKLNDFKVLLRRSQTAGLPYTRNVPASTEALAGCENRRVVPMSSFSQCNRDADGDSVSYPAGRG